MKLVFLDIDGVLVTPRCYAMYGAKNSGSHAPVDPPCVEALNRITDATGAKIVLSSTWRFEGAMFMSEKLREWGVKAPLVDVTAWPPKHTRDDEIREWLEGERFDVDSFVILDDEGMGKLKPHAVQTNGSAGLTMADADRAIALLNKPYGGQ